MTFAARAAQFFKSKPTAAPLDDRRAAQIALFRKVRDETEKLAAPLTPEDQVVQSMADASPTKWHRAHTTWFFEQFLLSPQAADYRVFDEHFALLFNSYYVAAGPRHDRPKRGLITRPGVAEIAAYRAHVDRAVEQLLATCPEERLDDIIRIVDVGLNHEQQHQELLLTDILHAFAQNPTAPAYDATWQPPKTTRRDGTVDLAEGIHTIGHQDGGFCFDNEQPAHRVLIGPVKVARALVTNEEWLAFMRWRLSHANALAVRRLGPGKRRGVGSPRLLAGGRRRLALTVPRRATLGRSASAGLPYQLLRGRCVRPMERPPSSERG